MTKAGTMLVPHLGEGKVVEYDLDGKVLWSVPAKSPWHAVRLKNGNTLIAGDWSRYAREVNPKGETVWEFTQADVPGIKLGNIQTAHRLANGNTVMCCWIAGDNNTVALAGHRAGLRSDAGQKSRLGFVLVERPGPWPGHLNPASR